MSEPGFIDAVLSTPLLQRAILAGALAGLCCAVLSPLVVLRRMAFVGDGMAHAAFGGLGLGLFLLSNSRYEDLSVQFVTLAFCLVMGLAVAKASRQAEAEKLEEDSAIGIAFSVSMALGALFIRLRQNQHSQQYAPPMDMFLFGSILNIGWNEIFMLLGIAAAVLATLVLFQKEILFYMFDSRLAEVSGVKTGFIHYIFMVLLVLTVVISSRVVGIVLVSASLILPGVIALKLCSRLVPAMFMAAAIGIVSFTLGLAAAYHMNLLPGSAIILIQFALYVIAAVCKSLERSPTPS